MRIIAGAWRGRALIAPPGETIRPTADRVRQALFDMLLHAPWAGPDTLKGARVLDAFAGTGALGLEALSRGAAHVTFMERDRAALTALRANIAVLCSPLPPTPSRKGRGSRAPPPVGSPLPLREGLGEGFLSGAEDRTRIIVGDALAPPRAASGCALVFLDPSYGQGLVPRALTALAAAGWIAPGALVVAETARDEATPAPSPLVERTHGAARLTVWRWHST
ncbi:MAG TPA: RsmD family RNA methyltransferase [Acetobacteraceae bacterium]